MADQKKINKLIKRLNRGPIERRKEAARALVGMGEDAVEPLIKILLEESSLVEVEIIRSLGQLKDTRAIKPLLEVIEREDSSSLSHGLAVRAVFDIIRGISRKPGAVDIDQETVLWLEQGIRRRQKDFIDTLKVVHPRMKDEDMKDILWNAWISVKEEMKRFQSKTANKVTYFEVLRPEGDGLCSDNDCPCIQEKIPRGSGYLYVGQKAIDFRKDALTNEALKKKLKAINDASPFRMTTILQVPSAILMCEQGAKLRGIDLDIAAEDAKYWWKTGLAPLRVTPKAGPKTKSEKTKPKGEIRAGDCCELCQKNYKGVPDWGYYCPQCLSELSNDTKNFIYARFCHSCLSKHRSQQRDKPSYDPVSDPWNIPIPDPFGILKSNNCPLCGNEYLYNWVNSLNG